METILLLSSNSMDKRQANYATGQKKENKLTGLFVCCVRLKVKEIIILTEI